jgi:hypothetical protein
MASSDEGEVPQDPSQDAGLRALLHRRRVPRLGRHRARRARLRDQVLHDEGNFDLVGNNMPVFFIQDGIKFPDLVHAIKPEPHNEMPQASAAHDTSGTSSRSCPSPRT